MRVRQTGLLPTLPVRIMVQFLEGDLPEGLVQHWGHHAVCRRCSCWGGPGICRQRAAGQDRGANAGMCASGRDCQVGPPFAAAGPLTSDVLRSLDSAERLRPRCNSSLAAVGGPWELSCAGHDPALCEVALALFCSASDADWLWRRRGDRGFCKGAVLPMVEMPCISNLHDREKLLIRELSDTVSSHDSQGR